jgi:hypothetical protein
MDPERIRPTRKVASCITVPTGTAKMEIQLIYFLLSGAAFGSRTASGEAADVVHVTPSAESYNRCRSQNGTRDTPS